MTAIATRGREQLCVIHASQWRPCRCTVAGIAGIGCTWMSHRFTGGGGTVMTTRTRTRDLRVIDARYRAPTRRRVTGFANIGA